MAVRSFQQIMDDIAKVQAAVEQERKAIHDQMVEALTKLPKGTVLLALSPDAANTLAHLLAHIPVRHLQNAGLPQPLALSPSYRYSNHRPLKVEPSAISGQPVIYI